MGKYNNSNDCKYDNSMCIVCPPGTKPTSDIEAPKVPDHSKIKPDIVTKIYVNENGRFDDYMNAGYQQLERLYKEGRIKGADFAAQHVEMTQVMMTEANKFIIAEYQLNIEKEKLKIELELGVEKIRSEKLNQQLLITKEDEERRTGATQRAQHNAETLLKNSECALVKTQKEELILNGKSKRALEEAQTKVANAQVSLYAAQADGFGDRNRNDTLKTIMNAWAIDYVEGDSPSVPSTFINTTIDNILGSAITASDGLSK